ncbi:citrate synthase, partial [Saccharolobus sp.]
SIIAKMATLVSNVYRRKEGNKPRIPEPSDSFAKSFLLASLAREPTAEEINAMDKALILYTDHEVPASTTAALVAASTLSDMYSSLTAALAALKGPLHGGAAEEAFKQFVEIGDPNRVEMWFNDKIINQKNRLMGFGHRVYKTYDPRAKIFKKLASTLIERNSEAKKYFEIAQKLEELGIKQFSSKEIYPNTDFYSGIVFYALGFPVYMFTALFALSRTLGWLAHIIEYVEEQHRLIRPRALYVGPEHQEYVPIDKR